MTDTGFELSLEAIRQETAANHAVFTRLRPTFADREGEYALMKSGSIVEFFANREAALSAGRERFVDGRYSVHRVHPNDRRRVDMTPLVERRREDL